MSAYLLRAPKKMREQRRLFYKEGPAPTGRQGQSAMRKGVKEPHLMEQKKNSYAVRAGSAGVVSRGD